MSDNIASIRRLGVEPFGVNFGDESSHAEFKAAYRMPFELLVDAGSEVSQAYGAVKEDGSGIARSVVVVGKNGKVIYSRSGAPAWPLVANVIKKADDSMA